MQFHIKLVQTMSTQVRNKLSIANANYSLVPLELKSKTATTNADLMQEVYISKNNTSTANYTKLVFPKKN